VRRGRVGAVAGASAAPVVPFALAIACTIAAVSACGKREGSPSALALSGGENATEEAHPEPMDVREADAWAHAKDGDDEDRMRLADLAGCTGLRERGSDPQWRATAIHAMAFCGDFSELPWLVSLGTGGADPLALDALQSVVDLAARPRRATDPEDAEELGEGCRALLAFARDAHGPKPRRVVAVRALRMLSERGCVKAADVPTDLDAK
jgi:hypothetical protein